MANEKPWQQSAEKLLWEIWQALGGGGGGGVSTDLTDVSGTPITLGQKAMAASLPVVLASDQSAVPVVGKDADGAVSTGNPVQTAGKDATGAVQSILTDPFGVQRVELFNGSDNAAVATFNTSVDGRGTAILGLGVIPFPHNFNGTTWDRQRNNTGETVLASAARTTAFDGPDMVNYNARGLHLVIDITTFTAGSITITIQGKDPVSGKYYNILTSAALAAVATTVLRVYPNATIAANLSINDVLPRVWRVTVAVADATSFTYSIGANLVL